MCGLHVRVWRLGLAGQRLACPPRAYIALTAQEPLRVPAAGVGASIPSRSHIQYKKFSKVSRWPDYIPQHVLSTASESCRVHRRAHLLLGAHVAPCWTCALFYACMRRRLRERRKISEHTYLTVSHVITGCYCGCTCAYSALESRAMCVRTVLQDQHLTLHL